MHEDNPILAISSHNGSVPFLRCTNRDCGHQWFERSQLAVGSDCPVCDEPTEVVGVDDEPPAELNRVSSQLRGERAHPGHAREKAREVLREHRIGQPPVVVHSVARKCGFEVRNSHQLGKLSARLAGQVIEVNAEDPAVRQRFSVAHELGHHFLRTEHGDGPLAEQEANAFAGELLVPGHMLRSAIEQTADTRELATLFKVSRQVLEIAAKHHKLFDQLR
jgi:predicted Zn-ribbon and HTH transcriptional regulator